MRLLLLVCSMLQVTAVNLCIHCKFFRPGFMADKKFGECVKFPKVEDNVEFYVTGKTWPQRLDSHYCTTARSFDHMCGKEGKLFEKQL